MNVIRNVLVTGGAGFIGSAVCRHFLRSGYRVVNVDALTYAGNLASLDDVAAHPEYRFVPADIADAGMMRAVMHEEGVDAVLHLAAESHVDRSIGGPAPCVETNIVGTFRLLEAALDHWRSLDEARRARFRFLHVSTDEVFGDLSSDQGPFNEGSAYRPSSPYSASKAASDHLVRAWHRTYGLPVVISASSNNYGPRQHPEKLIPLVILNAMQGLPLPVYGDGANVRDWLHVEDHARALEAVLCRGQVGGTYLAGARSERSNIAVVEAICALLDEKRPRRGRGSHRDLISFVADRPGHDRRYAVDPSRIEGELGWRPQLGFETGLAQTIDWYLSNAPWWRPLRG